MNTEDIKKALSDNRQRLYEAVAILQLIDHAEGTDCPANVYGAAAAAARMVDQVGDALDELDMSVTQGVQS